MADVRLVDLEVIKRFSLAVRCDTAPAAEVLAALDASRATVLAAMETPRNRAPKKAAEAASTKAVPTKAGPRARSTRKATTPITGTPVKKAAPARRRASE